MLSIDAVSQLLDEELVNLNTKLKNEPGSKSPGILDTDDVKLIDAMAADVVLNSGNIIRSQSPIDNRNSNDALKSTNPYYKTNPFRPHNTMNNSFHNFGANTSFNANHSTRGRPNSNSVVPPGIRGIYTSRVPAHSPAGRHLGGHRIKRSRSREPHTIKPLDDMMLKAYVKRQMSQLQLVLRRQERERFDALLREKELERTSFYSQEKKELQDLADQLRHK